MYTWIKEAGKQWMMGDGDLFAIVRKVPGGWEADVLNSGLKMVHKTAARARQHCEGSLRTRTAHRG